MTDVERRRTPAVVVGVLLLVVIGAQDLLVLFWEGRVCLACLRAAATTMRLWPEQQREEDVRSDEEETA